MKTKLSNFSERMFGVGLAITILLLPLDRFNPRGLHLSSISLLLLLQLPLVLLAQRRWDRLRRAIPVGAVLMLVIAAVWLSGWRAMDKPAALGGAYLVTVLAFRCWLIGSFTNIEHLRLAEKAILVVTLPILALGYYQFLADMLGASAKASLLLHQYSSSATFAFPRPQSTALEPLYLAHFLFLPIGLLVCRLSGKASWSWWFRGMLMAVMGIFFLTGSRGAWAGLAIILIMLAVSSRRWLWLLELVALMVGGLIIALALILSVGKFGHEQRPLLHSETATSSALAVFTSHAVDIQDESSASRYQLWPAGWKLFKQYPLLGVGQDNSRDYINSSKYQSGVQHNRLEPLNNDYLAFIAEEGLVGILFSLPLAGYLVMLVLSGYDQLETTGPYALALTGMAVQANTFNSLLLLRTWVVIALLIAASRAAKSAKESAILPI